MPNYFVSYDLNGKTPTHAAMDKHIMSLRGARFGRVLETVWYIHTGLTKRQLFDFLNAKLSTNDRLLVVEAEDAVMKNLLVSNTSIQNTWNTPTAPSAPVPTGLAALFQQPGFRS